VRKRGNPGNHLNRQRQRAGNSGRPEDPSPAQPKDAEAGQPVETSPEQPADAGKGQPGNACKAETEDRGAGETRSLIRGWTGR